MDPGVPVVDVAVEPQPVPVPTTEERLDHPDAGLAPDARAHTGVARLEAVADEVVEPRELADDLARAEIEVGRVDVAQHPSALAEDVVVGGPAPRALLAQQPDAVEHLRVPLVLIGQGGRDDRPAEAALPREGGLLPGVAVAVGVHPGGILRARLRPGETRCPLRRARGSPRPSQRRRHPATPIDRTPAARAGASAGSLQQRGEAHPRVRRARLRPGARRARPAARGTSQRRGGIDEHRS